MGIVKIAIEALLFGAIIIYVIDAVIKVVSAATFKETMEFKKETYVIGVLSALLWFVYNL